MKPPEVGMIVSKHRTLVRNGVTENQIITDALARSAGFLHSAHIMSQAAKLLDHWQREVLIRVESGHLELV
jgi:hypothetical protein